MTISDATRDWLGPIADQLNADQLARLDDLHATITARWPDGDPARMQVLAGALQVVVGDDTLEGLAQELERARETERDAMAALTGALLASASGERYGPGTESALAARAGVQRATVRKALGK